MSLTVPAALLDRAKAGPISDDEFIACVRDSLPYAWSVVSAVAGEFVTSGGTYADNQTPPPDEAARGQLLRLVASDAMRGAVERHFNVKLAFQNCHKLAMFAPSDQAAYEEFSTPRAQVLNQKPELVNC
ncbi:MAG TPA: SCO5389 family protein [Pseudonocardiaceae bacterium]